VLIIEISEVIVDDSQQSIFSALEEVFSNKVKQQDCIFNKLHKVGKLVNKKSVKKQILKDAGIVYCSKPLVDYNK